MEARCCGGLLGRIGEVLRDSDGVQQCTSFSSPRARACVCFVMHDLFAPNHIPQQRKCCFSPPQICSDAAVCAAFRWTYPSARASACVHVSAAAIMTYRGWERRHHPERAEELCIPALVSCESEHRLQVKTRSQEPPLF